jgi:hypothetical protein
MRYHSILDAPKTNPDIMAVAMIEYRAFSKLNSNLDATYAAITAPRIENVTKPPKSDFLDTDWLQSYILRLSNSSTPETAE